MQDFRSLSPLDFEELVGDLVHAEHGVRVERFGPGQDKGIDFRYAVGTGSVVVQAKHYARSNHSQLIATLVQENVKVARLCPSRYLLVTSLSMTPTLKAKIIAAMPDAPLVEADVWGLEDLNELLDRHEGVWRRHYKLWLGSTATLERILHSGLYHRSETELAVIQEVVPKFVQNESVDDAQAILDAEGSLIIAGEPGVGKSTLARILIWLHAAQDWKIYVVDNLSEAFTAAAPGEKRLIFFDDFLGQVQLTADHVRGIDRQLPAFLDRVRLNKNLRFILTTREYILSQAETLSQRIGDATRAERRYVLKVGSYTRALRARILYNHLLFSDLSYNMLDEIIGDDFYLKIIDHKNFNPRLIDLLTSRKFTAQSDQGIRERILDALNNPEQLWDQPYREHISEDGRAVMIALLMRNRQAPLDELQPAFARVSKAIGPSIPAAKLKPRFDKALRELEGSVAAIENRIVRFSNPGVRDYLQQAIMADAMLLPLVAMLDHPEEVREAWRIYRGPAVPARDVAAQDADAWTDALLRSADCNGLQSIARIEFALDMYEAIPRTEILKLISAIMDEIEETNLQASDLRSLGSLLETLALTSLPFDQNEILQERVTNLLLAGFTAHAWSMSIDEVDQMDKLLSEFGSTAAPVAAKLDNALHSYLEYFDQEMTSFTSHDELEAFERELRALINRRNYTRRWPDREIEKQRERIEEIEDEGDSTYLSTSSPIQANSGSEEAIKSIFRNTDWSNRHSNLDHEYKAETP